MNTLKHFAIALIATAVLAAPLLAQDGSSSQTTSQITDLNQPSGEFIEASAKDDGGVRVGKALHGTPVIDGKIDDIWKNVPAMMTDRQVEDENGLTDGQTISQASVKCLWDDGHLYCLAEVKDDKIGVEGYEEWEQDSVEFFVDPNMSKADYYDDDDAQYRTSIEGVESCGSSSSEDNYKSKVTKVDGGYIVEAAIKLKAEAGKKIGFDAQVNNDPGTGFRGSIAKWNDVTNNTYESLADVGVLELVKPSEFVE
jgi:endo-1,4-beta-xylanase